MTFAEFVKIVRTDGVKAMLLRGLYDLHILSMDQVGGLAQRLGNKARLDGFTFSMDNQLLLEYFKGWLVVGQYEKDELEVILKYLPRDEPVIELGASIGVVSCMVNRRLIAPNQHVVVEASPALIPTLKTNRDMNRCQFEIVEAAIGYGSSYITFYPMDLSLLGTVYDPGDDYPKAKPAQQVPAKTLQSIAENAGFRHFTLISDIEGSEIELIEHEIDFIREHVGLVFMEIHGFEDQIPYGEKEVKLAIETLQGNGFEMIDAIPHKVGGNYCFRNKASFK